MASLGRIGRIALFLTCATGAIANAQETARERENKARAERSRERETATRKDAAEQLKEDQQRAREKTKDQQERTREELKASQERTRETLEDKQKATRERTQEQQERDRKAKAQRGEKMDDRLEREQDDDRDGRMTLASGPPRKHAQADLWPSWRAKEWRSERRDWSARGGYSGFRVPSDKFERYYGATHGFRMQSLPWSMVDDRPRFRFGESSFSLVDKVPQYWPQSWYHADDVYITEERGGYYLVNRRFPGDRVAVEIHEN